jgi:hypothetical protein
MADQDAMLVAYYRRTEDDRWLYELRERPNAVVRLTAVGIELPLSEIYRRVELPPTTAEE